MVTLPWTIFPFLYHLDCFAMESLMCLQTCLFSPLGNSRNCEDNPDASTLTSANSNFKRLHSAVMDRSAGGSLCGRVQSFTGTTTLSRLVHLNYDKWAVSHLTPGTSVIPLLLHGSFLVYFSAPHLFFYFYIFFIYTVFQDDLDDEQLFSDSSHPVSVASGRNRGSMQLLPSASSAGVLQLRRR